MDHDNSNLERAKNEMIIYEDWYANSPVTPGNDIVLAAAQAHAAIAQAEQLERVANRAARCTELFAQVFAVLEGQEKAAIAQAEALTRIARSLEIIAGTRRISDD